MHDPESQRLTDPHLILGVSEDADDAAVEAGYVAALKRWPPERDAARFEAVRQAYETLRTRRRRVAHSLFDSQPPTLADLLERAGPPGAPRRPGADLFEALLQGED